MRNDTAALTFKSMKGICEKLDFKRVHNI